MTVPDSPIQVTRVLHYHSPRAFLLENVPNLAELDDGTVCVLGGGEGKCELDVRTAAKLGLPLNSAFDRGRGTSDRNKTAHQRQNTAHQRQNTNAKTPTPVLICVSVSHPPYDVLPRRRPCRCTHARFFALTLHRPLHGWRWRLRSDPQWLPNSAFRCQPAPHPGRARGGRPRVRRAVRQLRDPFWAISHAVLCSMPRHIRRADLHATLGAHAHWVLIGACIIIFWL